jgi:hypothetical protein
MKKRKGHGGYIAIATHNKRMRVLSDAMFNYLVLAVVFFVTSVMLSIGMWIAIAK